MLGAVVAVVDVHLDSHRGETTQARLEAAFQIARVFRVSLDEVFQYPGGG